MHINQAEVDRLRDALLRLAPRVRPSVDPAWSRPLAVRVIDCVLSLNRKYDVFVVPRLERFMDAHPQVLFVDQLARLIDSHPSPAAFVASALNYYHADRARVLAEVVDYVGRLVHVADHAQHSAILQRWATASQPDGFKALHIKGFKVAGWQYLRMLFGAQTTKPDKHIIDFVSEELRRPVKAVESLFLLEAASQAAALPIRDVDTSIWEARARGDHAL